MIKPFRVALFAPERDERYKGAHQQPPKERAYCIRL